MRNIISIGMMLMPAFAFGAAPFADQFNDHQRWIFPAFAYCLGFGVATLLLLFCLSRIWKTKTQELTCRVSSFLMSHRPVAIVVTGILLAIPSGVTLPLLWEFMWFLSIIPMAVMVIVFPLVLVNRRFCEKCLLTPTAIKWLLMISISMIAASLLFIILTDCDILPQGTATHLARAVRRDGSSYFYYPSHPYDSMKEIWEPTLLFGFEIAISLILYCVGLLCRFFHRKLSRCRRQMQ